MKIIFIFSLLSTPRLFLTRGDSIMADEAIQDWMAAKEENDKGQISFDHAASMLSLHFFLSKSDPRVTGIDLGASNIQQLIGALQPYLKDDAELVDAANGS